MSYLRVAPEAAPETPTFESGDPVVIARILSDQGIGFERWPLSTAQEAAPLRAYAPMIARLQAEFGYQSADVVSIGPDHPEKTMLRQTFLSEHTHDEDEVRFFVEGRGLFALHLGDAVYELFCQAGDLIRVPAHTRHWFDMGAEPNFTAIRLFSRPDGWLANVTGEAIAERFSRLVT